jgi:hypothetical protein
MCAALHVKSSNAVVGPLNTLKSKDLVDWSAGKSRTLHLTEKGWCELIGKELVEQRAMICKNIIGRLRYLDD